MNVPVFLTHMLSDMGHEMRRCGEDVISIAGTALTEPPPEHLKEATKKAIDQGYTGYPPLRGLYELREAISEKMKRIDSLDVDPQTEVLVTMGGEEAIFLAVQALISPGDEVLMTKPSYPFDLHIRFAGGTPVYVPLSENDGFKLNADEFSERITSKTRLLALVNPHNPIGRVFTRKETEDLAQVAQEHHLYVLEDTVNDAMIFDGRKKICMASLPGMRRRTIVVSSFTKCYGLAGWRTGYAVADRSTIDQMVKLHMMLNNVGPPPFAQIACEQIYRGPQEPLKQIVARCQERRDFMYKRINEIPNVHCHKPEGTCVAIPDISAYAKSSLDFAKRLLKEAKVVVAAGIQYHAEGCMRINFANPRIKEALDRIEGALKKRS
jgi:aspartate aminotransferase